MICSAGGGEDVDELVADESVGMFSIDGVVILPPVFSIDGVVILVPAVPPIEAKAPPLEDGLL